MWQLADVQAGKMALHELPSSIKVVRTFCNDAPMVGELTLEYRVLPTPERDSLEFSVHGLTLFPNHFRPRECIADYFTSASNTADARMGACPTTPPRLNKSKSLRVSSKSLLTSPSSVHRASLVWSKASVAPCDGVGDAGTHWELCWERAHNQLVHTQHMLMAQAAQVSQEQNKLYTARARFERMQQRLGDARRSHSTNDVHSDELEANRTLEATQKVLCEQLPSPHNTLWQLFREGRLCSCRIWEGATAKTNSRHLRSHL